MTAMLSHSTIDLPCLLFATQHEMDDYCAPDMLYGDLSAEVLRRQYHLHDISAHINPFTHPDRDESARILFDEFRYLSDTFAFWGPYKSLARTMISHMQYGHGTVFSDPLLNQAMAEHSSMKQTLNALSAVLNRCILISKQGRINIQSEKLIKNINEIRLPVFNELMDRFNSLGIAVHDTWSTHIHLDSLEINGGRYVAKIRFTIQDHFGLDDNDISNNFYRQFRLFRIWFILQRWEGYRFLPFITVINTVATIKGALMQ